MFLLLNLIFQTFQKLIIHITKKQSLFEFFFLCRNSKTRNTRVSLEVYFIYMHIKFTKTFVNKYLWLYKINLNRTESNLIPCLFIFISPKNSLQAFNAFCIIKKQFERNKVIINKKEYFIQKSLTFCVADQHAC